MMPLGLPGQLPGPEPAPALVGAHADLVQKRTDVLVVGFPNNHRVGAAHAQRRVTQHLRAAGKLRGREREHGQLHRFFVFLCR